jgi:hypothetical protein
MTPPLLVTLVACTLGVAPPDRTDDDDTDVIADTDPPAETDSPPDSDPLPDTDAETDSPPDSDGETDSAPDTDVETDSPADTDPPLTADPLIVEVCDPPAFETRFVEIHNPSATAIDLDGWSLAVYPNGASRPSSSAPLDGLVLAPGETLVIGADSNEGVFLTAYGAPADVEAAVISGNGDDAYALVEGTDVRDVYGEIGVDGTRTPWEYADTCARRAPGVVQARPTWLDREWNLGVDPSPFARD